MIHWLNDFQIFVVSLLQISYCSILVYMGSSVSQNPCCTYFIWLQYVPQSAPDIFLSIFEVVVMVVGGREW